MISASRKKQRCRMAAVLQIRYGWQM